MSAPTEPHATERTATARLAFTCHGYRCNAMVPSGEDYVRISGGGRTPWLLKLCVACYRQHDPGAPLPPRTRQAH